MTQPTLLENLRKAYMGNYSVILSLLGCLDHGMQAKRLVDRVIDASAFLKNPYQVRIINRIDNHVINLREDILNYRLKYSLTTMDPLGEDYLNKASKAIEK